MARIPAAELERIKTDIAVQRLVEGAGIDLKRMGKDLLGRCPFHDDAEASMADSAQEPVALLRLRHRHRPHRLGHQAQGREPPPRGGSAQGCADTIVGVAADRKLTRRGCGQVPEAKRAYEGFTPTRAYRKA